MTRPFKKGLTLVEMVITMAVLSLFLVLSAQVVSRYFHAYRQMDTSLPSQRSQAHNLEFLMRYLSSAQVVLEPNSKKLQEGFRPSWSDDESELFRVKLVDANGQETFSSLGYSVQKEGLLLVEYPVLDGKLGEAREQIFQTGVLELQTVQNGRKTLLRIRLQSRTPNRLPIQSTISLGGLLFETVPTVEKP
jgi:prepilin-type N-terminal cleavage/methylation domain-containing protein